MLDSNKTPRKKKTPTGDSTEAKATTRKRTPRKKTDTEVGSAPPAGSIETANLAPSKSTPPTEAYALKESATTPERVAYVGEPGAPGDPSRPQERSPEVYRIHGDSSSRSSRIELAHEGPQRNSGVQALAFTPSRSSGRAHGWVNAEE